MTTASTFVATPIYDSVLDAWKGTHDGREPGDVRVEDKPKAKPMPPRPRARKTVTKARGKR